MKCNFVGAVMMSLTLLHGGSVLEAQSVSRTLSVAQTTIKDVAPPVNAMPGGSDALDVLAWVDRTDSTYALGEQVRMFVQTSKDAYVAVLNVDPTGNTTVLFPNKYQSDNSLRANQPVEVPDLSSQSKVVVTGPVGTELLKVIASTKPFPLSQAMNLTDAGPFQVVNAEPRRTARSLTILMNRPAGGSQAAASAAEPARSESVSAEWAMCHQTIATIPTPAAALQRTRSLEVLRTGADWGSVTCDEAER